jgi:hypothetical protein
MAWVQKEFGVFDASQVVYCEFSETHGHVRRLQ